MLRGLIRVIERTIDFDESRIENRISVKPRVDQRLDEVRHFYLELPEYLSNVARDLSECYLGLEIDSLSIVYFPQIGFLITIPLTRRCTIEYLSSRPYLELQFATEKFAYLKDAKTKGKSHDHHKLQLDDVCRAGLYYWRHSLRDRRHGSRNNFTDSASLDRS